MGLNAGAGTGLGKSTALVNRVLKATSSRLRLLELDRANIFLHFVSMM